MIERALRAFWMGFFGILIGGVMLMFAIEFVSNIAGFLNFVLMR